MRCHRTPQDPGGRNDGEWPWAVVGVGGWGQGKGRAWEAEVTDMSKMVKGDNRTSGLL